MRSVRTMGVGLAVLVCAFAALSAPAFAGHGRTIETHLFGKFVASTTGVAKGHGTVTALRIGPYKFTGPELFETVEVEKKGEKIKEIVPKKNKAGEVEFGPLCKTIKGSATEDLTSRGEVKAGDSESIVQNLKFNHCVSSRPAGNDSGGLEEQVTATFTLGFEFHSNHSATLGESTSEVTIKSEGPVVFKGSKSQCTVEIPKQVLPVKAGTEKGENEEFESALYATEEESTVGEKHLEKKFGPVHDTLDIEGEFSKVLSEVPLTGKCFDKKGSPEEKVFKNGIVNFELEEIGLKDGNLSFVPAV